MALQGGGGRFSALLLEGLDHYRKGKMLDAVRAWEEAYLLEPTNLRAREFLRSALERIHAVMARSEEHTSELQSRRDLVCRLLLEKKKKKRRIDVKEVITIVIH